MNECAQFKAFMADQRLALQKAIDEDKWYMSEQQHHDVGTKAAHDHFIACHIEKWAAEFRRKYCTKKCALRNNCHGKDKLI